MLIKGELVVPDISRLPAIVRVSLYHLNNVVKIIYFCKHAGLTCKCELYKP